MSWCIGCQLPFLWSILKAADHQTLRERFQAANADQINALNELVMNMCRGQIPALLSTLAMLQPYQQALSERDDPSYTFLEKASSEHESKRWNTASNHCLRGGRVSSP